MNSPGWASASPADEALDCAMCGAPVERTSSKCGQCGADIGGNGEHVEARDRLDGDIVEHAAAQIGRNLEPNQATVAVALAGASWFGPGPLLSIPAWWLARRETKAIAEGRRSDRGRNIAAVAWWLAVMNFVAFGLGAGVIVMGEISRFQASAPGQADDQADADPFRSWLATAACEDLTTMNAFRRLPDDVQVRAMREMGAGSVEPMLQMGEFIAGVRTQRGCGPEPKPTADPKRKTGRQEGR